MKLHYGIVAVASITERFIQAVKSYGDEISAIASRDLNKARKMADKHQIAKAYGSYQELYLDPTIDIVYIATNNASHVEQIKLALQHGKHVLCEKPIALNSLDCEAVFKLAKEKNLFLMEAQKSVFLPVTNYIKEIITNQSLGRLHQVEMSSSFPNPSVNWMHDPTQGGVVYGSASYTLQYLDYLIEPSLSKVSACGILEPSLTCERVSINLVLDDVLANSRISMNGNTLNHAIFYFEKGYIKVPSFWKARECIITVDDKVEQLSFPIDYEMVYEVSHVHECIANQLIESPIMSKKRSMDCVTKVETIIKQLSL